MCFLRFTIFSFGPTQSFLSQSFPSLNTYQFHHFLFWIDPFHPSYSDPFRPNFKNSIRADPFHPNPILSILPWSISFKHSIPSYSDPFHSNLTLSLLIWSISIQPHPIYVHSLFNLLLNSSYPFPEKLWLPTYLFKGYFFAL